MISHSVLYRNKSVRSKLKLHTLYISNWHYEEKETLKFCKNKVTNVVGHLKKFFKDKFTNVVGHLKKKIETLPMYKV